MSYSPSYTGTTTSQLWSALNSDIITRNQLAGILAIDQLDSVGFFVRPCFFVFNSAPSWEAGRHWLCLYMPQKLDSPIEFFDSEAKPISYYDKSLETFIMRFASSYMYSSVRVQAPHSSTCGAYVLFFACHRCRDISFVNIVNILNTKSSELTVEMLVRQFYPGVNSR